MFCVMFVMSRVCHVQCLSVQGMLQYQREREGERERERERERGRGREREREWELQIIRQHVLCYVCYVQSLSCLVFVCLGYVIAPKRQRDRERDREREREKERGRERKREGERWRERERTGERKTFTNYMSYFVMSKVCRV